MYRGKVCAQYCVKCHSSESLFDCLDREFEIGKFSAEVIKVHYLGKLCT